MAPHADACEKMALAKFSKLIGIDVRDASLVDHAQRDVPRIDQVAEPLGSDIVNLVVVSRHHPFP